MPKARRVTGSMRGLTGADGMVYMEIATGRQQQQQRSKTAPSAQMYKQRNSLFRSRFK